MFKSNMQLKFFVAALALFFLALLIWGMGQVVQAAEGAAWLTELCEVVAGLGATLGVGSALASAFLLLKRESEKESVSPPLQPPEAPELRRSMKEFANFLSTLQPNIEDGEVLMLDARTKTEVLVRQIMRVVSLISRMEQQVAALTTLADAIKTLNREVISEAAGMLEDPILKRTVRCRHTLKSADYRDYVLGLLAGERATLVQWTDAYTEFAGSMFEEVSAIRDQIHFLQSGIVMLEGSRHLLEINNKLLEATQVLQLHKQPGLRSVARQSLPPMAVHFIERAG